MATSVKLKKFQMNMWLQKKGLIDKDRFYILKSHKIHIDEQFVWFGITGKVAKQYKRN